MDNIKELELINEVNRTKKLLDEAKNVYRHAYHELRAYRNTKARDEARA